MARFFSTVDGIPVGGPFVTYCQAQSFGIQYARENGLQQYQMKVQQV